MDKNRDVLVHDSTNDSEDSGERRAMKSIFRLMDNFHHQRMLVGSIIVETSDDILRSLVSSYM